MTQVFNSLIKFFDRVRGRDEAEEFSGSMLVKSSNINWRSTPRESTRIKMADVIRSIPPEEYTSRLRRYAEKRRVISSEMLRHQIFKFDFLGYSIESRAWVDDDYLIFVNGTPRFSPQVVRVAAGGFVLDEIVFIMDKLIYDIVLKETADG